MKFSRSTINAIILCVFSCTTLFAQETYEVSFTVDLSVQETAGIFDASSQIPRVTGNFAGWATTQAPSLTNTGNGIWSATLDVTTYTSMSKLEYKFILTRDDGGVFWEYAFNTSTSNREYAFTGSETDSDSDGKKEIALSHYFNDFEPEVLNNSIATAWMFPGGTPNLSMSGIITRAKGRFVFVQQDDWALQLYRNEDSNFWEAIDNGSLGVGDEIEFTGTMQFFEGLSNIQDVSNVQLLSSDNELPAPAELTLEELTTSFKDYQSELVLIKDLKVHAPDGTQDHFAVENTGIRIEEIATGDLIDMYVGYAGDSEVAWNYLPRQFDYIGIVGYYNPNEMTPHQLRPLYAEDLMIDVAPFGMPLPPHNNGDHLIVAGSFENFDLAQDVGGNEQWYFGDDVGAAQFNIVDRTDITSRALEVVISEHNDFNNDWHIAASNPWFKPADNESIKISFQAKGSVDGMRLDAAISLGEAFGYQRAALLTANLGTDWLTYEFNHFVQEGTTVNMYLEFLMNFAENSGGTIMIDNVTIEQVETITTPVTFSVNMASMIKIGDFDPDVDQVMLMGEKVNGWNTGSGVPMTALNDSIYSVEFEFANLLQDEVVRYKFMRYYIEDGLDEGYWRFESPDPLSDATDGPFQDRLLTVSDLTGVTAPTHYFGDIEPADLDVTSYAISAMEDLDLDVDPSLRNHHVAVQGIVTKISHNTLYLQDGTDAMMVYSYDPEFEPWGYAYGFNELTKDGTIEVGDELKVAGVNSSWSGGSMLAWAHAYEVVSTGNATPAQQIGLTDLVNDGESYENTLVQISGLQMNEEADTLRGGYLYEILEPSTNTTNYMWIRGSYGDANSEWDGLTPPQGLFSFKGVVQQVNLSIGTFYVPVPIDFSDITQQFEGFIVADMAGVLVGDTAVVDVSIKNLNTTLLGFEAEIIYNPEELMVEPVIDEGYGFDSFLVQSNEVSPGRWVVSAASAEGLDQDGPLFGLLVTGDTGGEFHITMSNININEEDHPDVFIPFLVANRLCGDVTNDQTVTALDATFILRNSVFLAPQYPLVGNDSLAADVTANGDITAFDASQILQYEVGLLDEFACGIAFKQPEPIHA
ncbi:MAG: carbohydrate-binding module family 20 domain-containing protein, partial [Bacteroidota bacterium]